MTSFANTLLSHEWLAPRGGSENVFEQLIQAMPGASLMCLWNDAPERFGTDVNESWMAKTPLRRSKAAALPFMPLAWRSVDLSAFERVISSSHAFGHHLAAHAAAVGLDARAYVYTPARYVWTPDLDRRGHGWVRRTAAYPLKRRDRRLATNQVSYATISEFVRSRIQYAWGLDAEVIYPPVNVEGIQSTPEWSSRLQGKELAIFEQLPDQFVLGASRLVEYKRLDLAMQAGAALDIPVVIAGDGPLNAKLRAYAQTLPVPVSFLGAVSTPLLYALYQRAALYVFMAVEDFGIMPIEAMAAGTPVLVNTRGGAAETVAMIGGGACASLDDESLTAAAGRAIDIDMTTALSRCMSFSVGNFQRQIQAWASVAP